MYRYILANIKTKMPIMHGDIIEDILGKYDYVARVQGRPYSRINKKDYVGESDETIINLLNSGGYYAYEDYLIIDTYNDKKFDTITYKDVDGNMSFSELLNLIKINIRNVNINKIID